MAQEQSSPDNGSLSLIDRIDRAYSDNLDLVGAIIVATSMFMFAIDITDNLASAFWFIVNLLRYANDDRQFWLLVIVPPLIGLSFFLTKRMIPLSYGAIEVMMGTVIVDSSAYYLAEIGGRAAFFSNIKDSLGLITAFLGGVYVIVRGMESAAKYINKKTNRYGFIPTVKSQVQIYLDERRNRTL